MGNVLSSTVYHVQYSIVHLQSWAIVSCTPLGTQWPAKRTYVRHNDTNAGHTTWDLNRDGGSSDTM